MGHSAQRCDAGRGPRAEPKKLAQCLSRLGEAGKQGLQAGLESSREFAGTGVGTCSWLVVLKILVGD